MIETIAYLREQLAAIYDPEETRAISRWVIEHVTGYTPAQQILAKDTPIDPQQREAIRTIVRRLKQHEPIQYIVGECTFHGLTFSVNPSVLIPRPETGELVERIVQRHGATPSLRVLDIGTGSGCIAITLSRQLLRPQVMALDLSAEAIRTAQGNAERNGAEVRFVCADLFDPHLTLPGPFDLIVSNPPYVRMSEKRDMAPHVLDYEPHTALFVPDADPLLFYRAIARRARGWLTPGGWLYFEINAALSAETAALLVAEGYSDVRISRDMEGKNRFAEGRVGAGGR